MASNGTEASWLRMERKARRNRLGRLCVGTMTEKKGALVIEIILHEWIEVILKL
jgi:hypothetical protein